MTLEDKLRLKKKIIVEKSKAAPKYNVVRKLRRDGRLEELKSRNEEWAESQKTLRSRRARYKKSRISNRPKKNWKGK